MTELIVTTVEQLADIVRQAVRAELGDREPRVEWLDTGATAALIGEHPKTTAKRARTGELPGRRLGREWRFRRVDVEAFLAGGGE